MQLTPCPGVKGNLLWFNKIDKIVEGLIKKSVELSVNYCCDDSDFALNQNQNIHDEDCEKTPFYTSHIQEDKSFNEISQITRTDEPNKVCIDCENCSGCYMCAYCDQLVKRNFCLFNHQLSRKEYISLIYKKRLIKKSLRDPCYRMAAMKLTQKKKQYCDLLYQ